MSSEHHRITEPPGTCLLPLGYMSICQFNEAAALAWQKGWNSLNSAKFLGEIPRIQCFHTTLSRQACPHFEHIPSLF